jgi:hypothetical protein
MQSPDEPPAALVATFSDPRFSEIEFGRAYAEQLREIGSPAVESRVYRTQALSSRAWVVADSDLPEPNGGESPLPRLDQVRPVPFQTDRPEHLALEVTVDGPSTLVVTDLFYPGWEATVTDAEGKKRAALLKMFDAWRGVKLDKPGTYHVEMRYRCHPLRQGATIGAALIAVWIVVWAAPYVRIRSGRSSG